MSASAPIANTEAQESQIEKQWWKVNVGFAAHFLGISPERVEILCKTGALRAERNRRGFWKIDEAFLIQWHEANPNARAADCDSNEEEEQRALTRLAARAPVPAGACGGHWERRGEVVPAFRVGLCRRCYSGRALPVKEDG